VKRRRMHLLFGMTALAFGLLAGYHGFQLQRAQHVNQAIASAGAGSLESTVPEAAFARAVALSRAGDYEAAVKGYKGLIQSGRTDLRRAALYNLGNLYLRRASKGGADQALESLPLIELAKQSYRDLLREDPGDWDAKYNLERALWLAPEVAEDSTDENRPSEFQRRVMRALPQFNIELP
jgi:mxaK protein